jgi:hypothetical protein
LICLLCIFGRSSHPCAMSMLTHAPMTLNVLDQALRSTRRSTCLSTRHGPTPPKVRGAPPAFLFLGCGTVCGAERVTPLPPPPPLLQCPCDGVMRNCWPCALAVASVHEKQPDARFLSWRGPPLSRTSSPEIDLCPFPPLVADPRIGMLNDVATLGPPTHPLSRRLFEPVAALDHGPTHTQLIAPGLVTPL